MTIDPQDVSLQSMDDVLVARNEQGHLIAPLLFLNREAVPEDAEDWDFSAVLVFSDGKTRATIGSTVLILYKGNGFTQTLEIETGGAWSISGVKENLLYIDPEQREGTGNAQIGVHRAPTLDVPGFYSTEFTLSINGAVANENIIKVFIYDGRGAGVLFITLDEINNYEYRLPLKIPADYELDFLRPLQGMGNSPYTVDVEEGAFVVRAIMNSGTGKPTSGSSFFNIIDTEEDKATVVIVTVDASEPLKVSWSSSGTYPYPEARHGETLTVTFTAPNYGDQYLTITRDRAWSLEGVESSKITATPTSGNSNDTVYLTKTSNFEVDKKIETQVRIVSGIHQWVDVKVIFNPPISGTFIAPPDGVGAPAGQNPVYIYL